jgi:hypothetical protein
MILHDEIDREGVYLDEPDATTYHPFLPMFRSNDRCEGKQAHHVMPLLDVHCYLYMLEGILNACSSCDKVWNWTTVTLPDSLDIHSSRYTRCHNLVLRHREKARFIIVSSYI